MIEKLPGIFKIDKLRALHIFESDVNAIFGILWGKHLMEHSEKNHQISAAQHGSRKGRGTDTILLTKHMTYALWRMTTTNGVTFDNDAKACYDRIVMNLAYLASQQLGMPSNICLWYQKFLNSANYHIQLPNYTSEQSYRHNNTHPLHGPGQGSRAAPSIWVIISSIIMQCMAKKSNGLKFQDPTTQYGYTHIMTGFVDDTTHWINRFEEALGGHYSLENMYSDTQATAQWW